MKIALITDLHAEEEFPVKYGADVWRNWEVILEDVQKRSINKIVFLGDIGSKAAHKPFIDSLQKFDFRIILGNHDQFKEFTQNYQPTLIIGKKEWYWSEEDERFKFIFLDTSTDAISQDQLDFLKVEIQSDKPILLFMHHPVLQTHTTPQLEYPLSGADEIKAILLEHNQQVNIYCGHLHLNDVTINTNITQTVTPAASVQIKRQSEKAEIEHIDFAYRILDLDDTNLTSEVVWFEAVNKNF